MQIESLSKKDYLPIIVYVLVKVIYLSIIMHYLLFKYTKYMQIESLSKNDYLPIIVYG